VHSLWSYKDTTTSRADAVRRRSQPCLLRTELESYAVPYQSPRSDEMSADQPSSEGDLQRKADQPLSSPAHAVVEKTKPDIDDAKATDAKSPTSAGEQDARGSDGGPTESSASSETALRRSASLRSSSGGGRKDADAEVGRVFVRRRAASFGAGGTSTSDVVGPPSRRHRRRMSSFSQRHPPPDDVLATTTAEVPRPRGRAEAGLPPVHRPGSGGRERRGPQSGAAGDRRGSNGERSTAGDASSRRHEQIGVDEERTPTEKDSGRRRHRQRHV